MTTSATGPRAARTVAVTGGSGFIGTHVVDKLLDAGCTVRVLDPKAPHRADAEWVPVDVLDTDGLTEAVSGADVIFHLAAIADVNDVIADPTLAIQVNTLGTARLLEAARRADAGRVVLASTVWVYAATTGEMVDEDSVFDPNTDRHLYVTSKVAAEMACRDYSTLYGRPFTVLRYGIPYGPRMRDNCVVAGPQVARDVGRVSLRLRRARRVGDPARRHGYYSVGPVPGRRRTRSPAPMRRSPNPASTTSPVS